MTPLASLPQKHFKVILCDNPWHFKTFSPKGEGRSASRHYKTMKLEEIKAMPVPGLAARDAHLFMWTSAPFLVNSLEVMKAWGFRYSSIAFTWVKLHPRERDALMLAPDSFHFGMGYTTRKNAEICLLGRKGSPKRNSKQVRELIFAIRREHSRKPDEAYTRIEEYADGPYLELFARTQRPGWTAWGNETEKFAPLAHREAAE